MQKAFALLAELEDGRPHSGQTLAHKLGVTRTAVWHHVKHLQEVGVDIHAVSGKGYRLPGGYEFLDETKICAGLSAQAASALGTITVDAVTDSTNDRLLAEAQQDDVHGCVRLAEFQTAGRGRRGSSWLAPPGGGLCLSLAWRFNQTPAAIGALSLVVGIGLIRALQAQGGEGLSIKWPNDIYLDSSNLPAKIAGILIEMRSELTGPSLVIIGTGLNIYLPDAVKDRIDQNAADLASACPNVPTRNDTAAAILNSLVDVLSEFQQSGFAGFRGEWSAHDFLFGRKVRLELADQMVVGTAEGVNENGMLLLNQSGTQQAYLSGHVELLE